MEEINTKAGYIAVIGKPNVGKSTLVNAIIGTKLSIVTSKPQTTRKRVLGIYSTEEVQAIFLDTPGILKPKYELHKSMMNYVDEAIMDADLLFFMIDIDKFTDIDSYFGKELLDRLKSKQKPSIMIINKIDLLKDVKNVLPVISALSTMNYFDEFVPISALKNSGVDGLIDLIGKYLPESPFYYDPELLSTHPERFFVSELIREHIFKAYRDEIPYSSEVNIAEFKEREKGKWYISANIIIERASQKGIIIGSKGQKIKEVGERARQDIEEHLQMPVFLELFVKVREKWRNDKNLLKSYGY